MSSADRTIVLADQSQHSFESDYQIRKLASELGLHTTFGPAPSIEMLLAEFAKMGVALHQLHPMKGPAAMADMRFSPSSSDTLCLCYDNPL